MLYPVELRVLFQRRSEPDRLEAEGNVRGKGFLTREIYSGPNDFILPLVYEPFRHLIDATLSDPTPEKKMRFPRPIAALNIVLALLFAVFAWFQRNDIDPAIYYHPSVIDAALWFLFYLLIAVLLVVILYRPLPRWLLIVAVVACLIEMGRTGPGLYDNLFGGDSFNMTQVSMSAADPRVELSREFFGALIALAGTGLLIFQNRKRVNRV